MKMQKVKSYKPNYARAVKGAVITVAAIAALSGTVACEPPSIDGLIGIETPAPEPTEDVTETGYVDIENTPYPDEELTLSGEIAIDESELPNENDDLTLTGAVYIDPNGDWP